MTSLNKNYSKWGKKLHKYDCVNEKVLEIVNEHLEYIEKCGAFFVSCEKDGYPIYFMMLTALKEIYKSDINMPSVIIEAILRSMRIIIENKKNNSAGEPNCP